MMLYRSLVLGLIGALVMIEVARPAMAPRPRMSPPPIDASAGEPPTIVDVARAALDADVDLGAVVGLHLGERVARIDDRPVTDGTRAMVVALRDAGPGAYLDLDVLGAGGARRVLVLVH